MTEGETYSIRTIGLIGGTGKEGKGLAYRWAKAGYKIIIGSRSAEKAQLAAAELGKLLPEQAAVTGRTNSEAAMDSDIVVITVPYAAHSETLRGLKPYLSGKILVDVTVPLVPPRVTRVQMPLAGVTGAVAGLLHHLGQARRARAADRSRGDRADHPSRPPAAGPQPPEPGLDRRLVGQRLRGASVGADGAGLHAGADQYEPVRRGGRRLLRRGRAPHQDALHAYGAGHDAGLRRHHVRALDGRARGRTR